MRTSEVLNKAADLIERVGWRQGDHGSGMCVMDALGRVGLFGGNNTMQARSSLQQHLGVTYVWEWNDRRDRTASEVIEVLRACALIEAAREDQDAAEATYAANLAVSA